MSPFCLSNNLKSDSLNTFHYKGINVSYSDSGSGTAVVLLHGFLENSLMWDGIRTELEKKYRIVTIDLLGHGLTHCLGYVHTMEDNADMVHAVLGELKIRKAIFAGHSMGGYVALAFAELYPDNIKALALINSTSKADSDERKKNRDRAIKAVKQNYTAFVQLSVANLFSEENRERLQGAIAKTKEQALKTPLQGIVASLEGMKIRKDREVILHSAAFPILLVLGEKDGVLNYAENKVQIEGTSVELETLPSGHMSAIESKHELIKILSSFLKKS